MRPGIATGRPLARRSRTLGIVRLEFKSSVSADRHSLSPGACRLSRPANRCPRSPPYGASQRRAAMCREQPFATLLLVEHRMRVRMRQPCAGTYDLLDEMPLGRSCSNCAPFANTARPTYRPIRCRRASAATNALSAPPASRTCFSMCARTAAAASCRGPFAQPEPGRATCTLVLTRRAPPSSIARSMPQCMQNCWRGFATSRPKGVEVPRRSA